jgi:hypothetical protein
VSVVRIRTLRLLDAQRPNGWAIFAVATTVEIGLLLEEHFLILVAARSVHIGCCISCAGDGCDGWIVVSVLLGLSTELRAQSWLVKLRKEG